MVNANKGTVGGYRIVCIKDGRTFTHSHRPDTRDAALSVGHELTRDKVADFFRVEAPLPWWKAGK